MAISKKKKEKRPKVCPVSFRFDETTAWRVKVLAAYFRRNHTVVVENLINTEFEKLQKVDGTELKKAEQFVQE